MKSHFGPLQPPRPIDVLIVTSHHLSWIPPTIWEFWVEKWSCQWRNVPFLILEKRLNLLQVLNVRVGEAINTKDEGNMKLYDSKVQGLNEKLKSFEKYCKEKHQRMVQVEQKRLNQEMWMSVQVSIIILTHRSWDGCAPLCKRLSEFLKQKSLKIHNAFFYSVPF